jgi:integrase
MRAPARWDRLAATMATLKLTDRQVAAARADRGARLELWDKQTPGLALRVSDQGRKTWVVRYRTDDGRQPRFTLGTYPTLGLSEARDLAADVIRDAKRGGDPSAEKRRSRAAAKAQPVKTLADLAEAYFQASGSGEYRPKGSKKRASTLQEEKAIWRRYLKESLGELRLEDVSADAIKKVLRGLVAKGLGTTSNRVRSLLRQMLNFAISEERLTINPVAKVPVMSAETPRERVLTDKELRAVWAGLLKPEALLMPSAEGEKPRPVYIGPSVSMALRLLLLTLTRRSELAGMAVSELDFAQASWTIPGERTKNGRSLMVPLSTEAVRLIRESLKLANDGQEQPSLFVFPSPRDRSKPITAGALSHTIRDIRLALGLDRFTPHDLRRTAATAMASERLGISPFLIGRLLNHTTETGGAAAVTLQHYALHDYAGEKRRALQAWSDLLATIVRSDGAETEK